MLRRSSDSNNELVEARRRVAELERELAERATYDQASGLLTSQRLHARLDSELRRTDRYQRPLALALLDLDGFRELNESRGRADGDRALAAAGRAIAASVRDVDVTGRCAADEFAVLMPETELDEARRCLERVCERLEENEQALTASVGVVACFPGQSADEALGAASKCMQQARRAGGGRVICEPDEVDLSNLQQRDAVSVLAVTLLERDHYTGEHSRSVVQLAASVSQGLGLDQRDVEAVRAAALLHDIGKVGVPDEILNKPGALSDSEWRLMKDHTIIGERILRAIPGMGAVARIVRHEHERWDGAGYPDGIAGEQIPIGSRIILACDAYHAMTSDRSYRKAMSHPEAIDELTKNVDSQFDARVVGQLVGHLYGSGAGGGAVEAPSRASGALGGSLSETA